MADNVVLDAGSGGETCATDDVGGVQYQRVKLADGTADSSTVIAAGTGTAATSLRVNLATDVALPAGTNAIGKLAANSGVDIGDVDVTTLPAITIAGAQTLATVTTVGTVSSVTAIANALPAGNNNIGDVDVASLPALVAGTANIGDVDVLTVPADPFGANADAGSATGSISAKLRFIASTGIPITGTVTVGSHAVTNAGTFATQPAGSIAHDGGAAAVNPNLMGAYASAAAPSDVSADNDSVRLWALRNGAQAIQPTFAGVLGVAGNGASGTGVQRVTVANDSTGILAGVTTVATVTNITNQGHLADDAAFTPATTRVMMNGYFADETATDSVDEGDGGAARMTLDRKQIVTLAPHTAGGPSIFRSLDIDETEEEIKASAGQIYWIHAMNMVATARYLKFYNATAANVTVGSTTPVLTFPIPANSTTGAGFVFNIPQGIPFATAISVACTTGVADADTGAPGANDVIINIGYA